LFVLPHGKSFRLFFEKEGYLHKSEHLLADSGTWRTYILEKPTPGARLTLRAVFFEHDSHELLPASQMELERVVEFMKTYPGGLEIQGHTSATGKPEYNLQLSRRRAEAVKHFLISRGVDEKRLSTVGFGETKPIASNDTYAGRALNRRIEIVLK
jgi:outer membrane protein OmpA-like peptidoglycan-associated protein